MAAHEDEAQALVGDLVHVVLLGPLRPGRLGGRQQPRELLELLAPSPLTAQAVDRPVASGDEDPGSGIRRHAVPRPATKRDDERLLHGILCEVDVAERPHERRDRPPRLLAEEAGDRPVLERRYRSTSGLTSTTP